MSVEAVASSASGMASTAQVRGAPLAPAVQAATDQASGNAEADGHGPAVVIDAELTKLLAELRQKDHLAYHLEVGRLVDNVILAPMREKYGDALTNELANLHMKASDLSDRLKSDATFREAFYELNRLTKENARPYNEAVDAYEKARLAPYIRQGSLETFISQQGLPGALSDAVRTIERLSSTVGGAKGKEARPIDMDKIVANIRRNRGDEAAMSFLSMMYRSAAQDNVSRTVYLDALTSRYRIEGSVLEPDAQGLMRMGDFTLTNIAGGFAIKHDGNTGLLTLFKDGVDVTEQIYASGFAGSKRDSARA